MREKMRATTIQTISGSAKIRRRILCTMSVPQRLLSYQATGEDLALTNTFSQHTGMSPIYLVINFPSSLHHVVDPLLSPHQRPYYLYLR
jgi:hypothetical protein